MSSRYRKLAFLAAIGTGLITSPILAIAADGAPATPPAVAALSNSATGATPVAPRETVEQRIASLHASLKITPDEEANWNGVTRAMRNNASNMEKLAAHRSAVDPSQMSAVDDLRSYRLFAQAHVNGLKALSSSFEILYKAMPSEQKMLADKVFQNFGHEGGASHG